MLKTARLVSPTQAFVKSRKQLHTLSVFKFVMRISILIWHTEFMIIRHKSVPLMLIPAQ